MEITKVTKRKSGTIDISYIGDDGKYYGLLLSAEEIVKNYNAAQQLRAVDERNASALEVNPETELVAPVEVALAAHH